MRHAPRQTPPFGGVAIKNQERAIIVRVVVAAFAILLSFCVLAAPVVAETVTKKPSKESLLEVWEQDLKKNEYTVKLEKSAEQGVYDYETTIFPYSGKLKVLNVFIDEAGLYNYDEDEDGTANFTGTVEIDLTGFDKNLEERLQRSYGEWKRGNTLYYHEGTQKWYSLDDWAVYRKNAKAAAKDSASVKPVVTNLTIKDMLRKLTYGDVFNLLLWVFLFFLIGWMVWMATKTGLNKQKLVFEKNIIYMDRAQAHMEKTERLLEEIKNILKQKQ